MYKKVLVPIVGQYDEEIAKNTLDLIDDRDVEVIILYVIDVPSSFLISKSVKETIFSELKSKGKIFLNNFEDLLDLENNSHITTKKLLNEGNADEKIVEIAKSECVDVIVMGTGKNIIDKHILGSVSEKVVHHAPCTIHLVRTITNKTCSVE
ncbi:universal stress protein [Methanobrevibacter filiformis]|uniref:Putative universal stress protein n=1 Tax=Methanobrevibacter filiformis TaxID=55758 RepID=A0A166A740_9EURY|nr:universal stress protein [Methanobrevibacter filiformis]KZX11654.1 putative universal stress protein [Methanobrevibacter filiformis]